MQPADSAYDPRLLVFEFTYNMILRKQQYELIQKFIAAVAGGRSLCHQMIMGAGKTTVIAPLLSLLLSSHYRTLQERRLVLCVVPAPLLEMSISVLRSARPPPSLLILQGKSPLPSNTTR